MKKWTAEQIKSFRDKNDLTQKELAELTGVSNITVFQWEREERMPSKTAKILLSLIEEGAMNSSKKLTNKDFEQALSVIFTQASKSGLEYVEVVSGDLHRGLGGYPGTHHYMPTCCSAMKKLMKRGDEILYQPPKGKGATVKIKYKLPR